MVDRFRSLVKPEFGTSTRFISQLTYIRNEELVDAPDFSTSLNYFIEWIGDKEVEIYSWSNIDWKQLQNGSRLKKYSNNRLEKLYEN